MFKVCSLKTLIGHESCSKPVLILGPFKSIRIGKRSPRFDYAHDWRINYTVFSCESKDPCDIFRRNISKPLSINYVIISALLEIGPIVPITLVLFLYLLAEYIYDFTISLIY